MNVTTSYRTFWLEIPIQTAIILFPTILLFHGLGSTHITIVAMLGIILLQFSHANLPISFGKFDILLISPAVHRIHHSMEPEHRNKNFAQYFPFLDVFFGTYYAPKKNEVPATGINGYGRLNVVDAALIRPFRKWFTLCQSLLKTK